MSKRIHWKGDPHGLGIVGGITSIGLLLSAIPSIKVVGAVLLIVSSSLIFGKMRK